MKHDRWNIEPAIFWPTILIFAAVSVGLFVGGDTLFTVLSSLLQTLTTRLGWVYLWIYIINFIFLGWLAFSKYGSIKFGAPDEKPPRMPGIRGASALSRTWSSRSCGR